MNILYVPNLCILLTLSLKCPDHQRTQLVVISRWFWMKELRTPKMRFEKSRSWQFLYYHRHHRRQQRYLHCQVLQRAAGFFAGHNDNYNVSWADAARFLAIDVETHQLLYAGWIIAALFRMINDKKEDPSKPPLPGCNVQFVWWRTRWVLEFFQGLEDVWMFVPSRSCDTLFTGGSSRAFSSVCSPSSSSSSTSSSWSSTLPWDTTPTMGWKWPSSSYASTSCWRWSLASW